MSRIIHIPSSMMTDLPSYNLVVNNKIDAINYSYNNVSLSDQSPYSFTIRKNENQTIDDITIDEQTLNADIVYKTKIYSSYFGKDITVLLIRKRLSLNEQIISLDYYIGAGGNSYHKNVAITIGDNQFNAGSEIKTSLNYLFEDVENFNISSFLPDIDIEKPEIYIDISRLKYNFVDFVFYFPLEAVLSSDQLNKGATVKMFTKTMTSNDIYVSVSGTIYDVDETVVENDGYSLQKNELYQKQTTINDKPIYEYIENDILSKWSNGRQTMSLTCVYGKYYDYNTKEMVLNGTDGKMVEVGDIVIPTKLYTNTKTNVNSEVPIALNSDGSEKQFEVLGSEIEFNNGKLVTHLKLMEVK